VFDFAPPVPGSYALPPIKTAADGRVLDSDGTPHRLHDLLRGKVTLLSFVYTRCADPFGCPLATGALFDLFDASATDPPLRRGLQLLSLSFDPAHDPPARMADYGAAALAQAGEGRCSWRFLTTASEAELAPILDGYGQGIDRRLAHEPGSTINHLLRVYLIDPSLRVRNIYGVEFLDPRLLLADVRTLLLEHDAN
jgi:cytochrome oxidase Cu insertion factor (SCO1/SenC/PrrC family)